jgi:esterase/lipase superfamily enzyme
VRERTAELYSPVIRSAGMVRSYGHGGRPALVFPSECGHAHDFAGNGMVRAVADLVEAGRVTLHCVDSYDGQSWAARDLPTEERARRHGAYESWILDQVVPHIGGDGGILTIGCSLGAFHAVNFALKHATVFPVALAMSGNYDPSSWNGWGEHGEHHYFNNPMAYVPGLHGADLDRLRERVRLVLVCGQGMWEDTTGSLESTRKLAALLDDRQIPHELDLWGHDVPHDWPSWRAQLAHHLPRLC